jgi:hypothetical protein
MIGNDMSDTDHNDIRLHVSIAPSPTNDERDAIIAALTVLRLASEGSESEEKPLSKWLQASREESLRSQRHGPIELASARTRARSG